MLRAIFFLDCDFCHESHSSLLSLTDSDEANLDNIKGSLEESAYHNGWCHCLEEDTGEYRLICGGCDFERG